jgi:hypothetical protein
MPLRDRAAPSLVDRLGPGLLLVWGGLSIGVAFVATPAKFLAPSLPLGVALDVGRHTFRVYSHAELVLLAALLALGPWSAARRRWYLTLAGPAVIALAQAFWLLPELDGRVQAILGGGPPPAPSSLHVIYIVAEALKLLWLLGFGLGALATREPAPAVGSAPSRRFRRTATKGMI